MKCLPQPEYHGPYELNFFKDVPENRDAFNTNIIFPSSPLIKFNHITFFEHTVAGHSGSFIGGIASGFP
jgi:hypothetical protein